MKKTEINFREVAEYAMYKDLIKRFPEGILSLVSDQFDLWQVITKFLPRLKEAIMARDGKLVIRPDSGDPVDIICGAWEETRLPSGNYEKSPKQGPEGKGVIELLWDIFGGTINEQGFKVLDPHIGAIYGDSITLDRQTEIYKRLAAKGFAATNIVLGVGSYTYQMNTRDTLGFAAKGSWFEVEETYTIPGVDSMLPLTRKVVYDIYKEPVTDTGKTKKSLKGLIMVDENLQVHTQCTPEQEASGILQIIYEDGKFHNQTTLSNIHNKLSILSYANN